MHFHGEIRSLDERPGRLGTHMERKKRGVLPVEKAVPSMQDKK
jgi:hypothetical protein